MKSDPVLFVDDNVICSIEIGEFLRERGFNVLSVHTASAARDRIDRREGLAALVTDIDLGAGDDGFDVARWARQSHAHLPVIYISGTAAGRHVTEGVCDSEFIAKPLHPQQIVDALRRLIHAQAA